MNWKNRADTIENCERTSIIFGEINFPRFDESLPILLENCSKRAAAVYRTTSIKCALF